MATDPSALVPQGLLRHIHLISNYQFPKLPQFNLDIIVQYLIQAPQIVKEQAPMNWSFLQSPQDGDILLAWQPPQMGVQEASDGYVWFDPESAFSSEMRGYKVEMYVHKSGFRMPNEPMASHARRRLRLMPSQNPDPNLPPPDPSLWIIHYHQAEPQNHFPSRSLRVSDQVRQSMSERIQLQRHGQLVRKEFMLRDGASWPTINLPSNPNPGYPQQAMGYPNDVMAHNRNQQQAYLQQQQANATQRGVGPSPAKRQRHSGPMQGHPSATAIPAPTVPQESSIDDEDGTVGGDYMDHLTPRDISLNRYLQHHEWLEEILESSYDTNQIIPGELGLGRKGELESLTRDFFDAPTTGTPKVTFPNDKDTPTRKEHGVTPRVGRLEAGKAEDFTKRASEKVAEINAEMERLKRQHTRRMAKLNKGRALKEAEETIRTETLEVMGGDTSKFGADHDRKINEYAQKVTGKNIMPFQDVECSQKGGLEEKSEARSNADQDYDMVDNFAFDGPRSEPPPRPPVSENPPTNNVGAVTDPSEAARSQAAVPEPSHNGGADASSHHVSPERPKDSASEDWIMVNKEGNSGPEDQDLRDLDSFANDTAMLPNTEAPATAQDPAEIVPPHFTQGSEVAADGTFGQGGGGDAGGGFEANDFGEGIDFGDLDTAGAELSGYAEGIDTVGLDEPDLGTGDTAFGEAFQGMDESAAPREGSSGT